MNEDVVNGIEEYVGNNNIDVLGIMPRKHNLFERLFKGSTTRKIVESAAIPVFGFHGS
jgi:nucleotide-binding universal stress UspA family protein